MPLLRVQGPGAGRDSPDDRAKLLGHTHIETTACYAHLARDSAQEAAERVAASIAEDIP